MSDDPKSYVVLRDGEIVEINGHDRVPTLNDAMARVPFHVGITIGEMSRRGEPIPGHYPFDDQPWPFEAQPDGSYRLKVYDWQYEIRQAA